MSHDKKKRIIPTHTAATVIADQLQCPVASITGIWKLRIAPNATTVTNALPGHLLHYVISGKYTMFVNGKEHSVNKGDIIHYFGTEEVAAINKGEAVEFYSLAFDAPTLPLPTDSNRVFRGDDRTEKSFQHLYELGGCKDMISACETYAELFNILHLVCKHSDNDIVSATNNLWKNLERQIRSSRNFRASVPELCEQAGISASTLQRACIQATGVSPARRLREIRMNEAKGLLLYSDMSATAIALELGYQRLHEFSRDVKKTFGVSPRSFRSSCQQ